MPDMPPNILSVRRRYTSPVWKPGSGTDHAFEAIFNESAAVSAKLGKLLTSAEGISIAQCKDALDKAAATPGDGKLETGVFEPHAAAAASLAFTTAPVRFILVFDIGAGTTDVAAFEFDESTDPPSLTEVREARQCSALAGDEIDRILVDLFFRKRGGDKTREDEIRLLRGTKLAARELKKELFTYGKASLKGGFLATTIKINDLLEDEQFRAYLGALGGVFANALSKVAARAQVVGADVIDVVLAGGGSNLPFLPALVRKAATDRTGTVSLRVGPLSPSSSLYDGIDPSLSSAFPQIAMSVGGALVERMDSAA
jgi:molecular chaperone DnaK (HSP70)